MTSPLRATSLASTLVSSWSAAVKGKARAVTHTSIRSLSSTAAARQAVAETVAQATASTAPSTPSSMQINTPSSALELLKSQPAHYIVASIAGRTLTLNPRDVFTLPRLRDLQVGDVVELERIHEVGSRDYTLRAQDPMSTRHQLRRALMVSSSPDSEEPKVVEIKSSESWAAKLAPRGLAHVGAVLPPSTVRARCVVVEHTKGALERITKRKRRKDYKRTVTHQQTYTRLRLEGIKLGDESA